jgi:TonB family protein
MQLFAARFGFIAVLASASLVHAQTAPAASSPTPTERAQHDADKVFRMILQHADKPRRPPRDEPPPIAAPRTPAAKGAPAAAAAPVRAADKRVTATTPPGVPAVPTASIAPPASGVASSSSDAIAAQETAPVSSVPSEATVAAQPLALAPVTSASPRSLKLEVVSSVEPEFPARLVRTLGQGSVVVTFDVRPDGTVARAEVSRSSHRGLNDAALAAVTAWRFKPISETMPGVVELKFE